jgi:ribose transport system permease protein
MADDKVSGGIEPAAAARSETGSNSDKTLVAATFKTADARARVSLPETAVLFAVLAVLVIFFSITSQFFLNSANLINILQNTARIGIVACAATLLLISGQFDLSVGSASAFVAMVAAITAATSGSPITPGLPLWVAILAGAVAALLVGVLNAVSVTVFRINALITTLATLAILRGLTRVVSDGQTVRLEEFGWLGTARVLGLPIPVFIFAAVVVVFFFILRYTTYGRSMYAIGASPTAARLAGIRTDRAIFIAFVLSAGLAGLSGLILVSQVGSASPNAGIGLELAVVTAVVLGGASLSGGRGSIVGTTLAVLIIGVLGNGLIQLAVQSFWIDVAGGVLLLVAVGFDQVRVRYSQSTG